VFNKFQDYILNTTTVNRKILIVMLLFNIFSLQFTVVVPLFYKSAGIRSKFLLAPIEISGHNAVEHFHRS